MPLTTAFLLSLIAAAGLSSTAISLEPKTFATQKSPPAIIDSAFLIVPRHRVGKITKQTNQQELIALFGKVNLKDFIAHGAEGQGNYPATEVNIGGQHSLDILWQDSTHQKVSKFQIYDPRWHTVDGLAVNTSVTFLQQKFGKFSFFGFEWDYGGLIVMGNPKLDQYRKKTGVDFTMAATDSLCQKYTKDCEAVMGDIKVSSASPHLVPLKVHISLLTVEL
jgi:hypothetical protein